MIEKSQDGSNLSKRYKTFCSNIFRRELHVAKDKEPLGLDTKELQLQ